MTTVAFKEIQSQCEKKKTLKFKESFCLLNFTVYTDELKELLVSLGTEFGPVRSSKKIAQCKKQNHRDRNMREIIEKGLEDRCRGQTYE